MFFRYIAVFVASPIWLLLFNMFKDEKGAGERMLRALMMFLDKKDILVVIGRCGL